VSINTNKFNWGEALKVEVGDLSGPGTAANGSGKGGAGKGPMPTGTFAAFVKEVKHGTFKKGSYGITLTYVIESGAAKNRTINEYIVLTKADGTNLEFSAKKLKQRLMNLGLPIEKINAFKGPRNEHDLGDFRLVIGAPVTVTIAIDKDKDGNPREYEGRVQRRVAAVYSREVGETTEAVAS